MSTVFNALAMLQLPHCDRMFENRNANFTFTITNLTPICLVNLWTKFFTVIVVVFMFVKVSSKICNQTNLVLMSTRLRPLLCRHNLDLPNGTLGQQREVCCGSDVLA